MTGWIRRFWLRFSSPAFAPPRYVNHRAKHYRRGGWR
jgi:hypothetical protein